MDWERIRNGLGIAGIAMRGHVDRALARVTQYLSARRVAPESVTLVALLVSVTAGIVLAAGGAAREPTLWLFVPSLGLVRLALYALETRLVDCRLRFRRTEERAHGQR